MITLINMHKFKQNLFIYLQAAFTSGHLQFYSYAETHRSSCKQFLVQTIREHCYPKSQLLYQKGAQINYCDKQLL